LRALTAHWNYQYRPTFDTIEWSIGVESKRESVTAKIGCHQAISGNAHGGSMEKKAKRDELLGTRLPGFC